MSGKNKFFLLCVVLLLFSVNAFASQLSVSIAPKNKAVEILQLYLDESSELEVTVLNNEGTAIENLNIKITVGGVLSIIKDDFSTTVVSHTIVSLGQGQSESFFVRVRPKELSNEKQFVSVNYGFEEFTHLVATYVEIVESPLEVQARLEKGALDLGESSKLALSLKNKSKVPLSKVTAELVLPSGIVGKSSPLSIDTLSPGESISDREFLFDVDPIVLGEKKLVLLVSFEDAAGKHILERDFFVDVQDRKTILYLIVIVIIVLVVVALYLKRKPVRDKKPLEQPELQEVEGAEVKTLPDESKEIKK